MGSSWCAIRTYPAHAEELGNETPSDPVFFLKPPGALVESPESSPASIEISGDERIQHEVELVMRLGRGIEVGGHSEDIASAVDSISIGLDLTDRKLQSELKREGLPWARAKVFPGSAVVGNWVGIEAQDIVSLHQGWRLRLLVNGEERTSADTRDMVHTPMDQLLALSEWAPMQAGDLIFTGTPKGVGWLNDGDVARAELMDSGGHIRSALEVHFCAPPALK